MKSEQKFVLTHSSEFILMNDLFSVLMFYVHFLSHVNSLTALISLKILQNEHTFLKITVS